MPRNNGVTLWTRDVDAAPGTVIRVGCLTSADLGEATRVKDDDPCLEDPDGFGSDPGSETESADSIFEIKWDDTADIQALFNWLNDGRPLEVGEVEKDGFKTDMGVAFSSGIVFLTQVWVYKIKLLPATRGTNSKLRVTYATNSLFTRGKADYTTSTGFPTDFTDYQAPIDAYYTALAGGASIAAADKKVRSQFKALPVLAADSGDK